jgi:hypothetical protein
MWDNAAKLLAVQRPQRTNSCQAVPLQIAAVHAAEGPLCAMQPMCTSRGFLTSAPCPQLRHNSV